MRSIFAKFAQDNSGATAIEYGLITSIVALGIIASLTGLRDSLQVVFGLVVAGFPN